MSEPAQAPTLPVVTEELPVELPVTAAPGERLGVPAPEPAVSPEGEQPEPGEPEGEPDETYETWLERIESNPALKEAHESTTRARDKEIGKEQYRKFQSSIQPAIDRWSQHSVQTRDTLGQMYTRFQKAANDGTLDGDVMQELFQQYKPAMEAFNGQMWWEGSHYVLSTIGKVLDDDSLANEYLGRLYRMATDNRVDPDFASDLMERITEPLVEKKIQEAEKRGYDKGLKAGKSASTESARAASRKGQGPDLKEREPGGGGNSYRNQREAEILHVQGKITNNQMREARRTLPF